MTSSHLGKIALGIVGAVILVAGLVALNKRDPVPQVVVERARIEALSSAITSNGKVEPISPETLRAQLSTFVLRVSAAEGQAVRRDQVLLTLDAAEINAQIVRLREQLITAEDQLRIARSGGDAAERAQLERDLRRVESDLARLRRDRDALNRLFERQAATREEVDQNRLALDQAELDLRLIRQKLEERTRRAHQDTLRASLAADQARLEIGTLETRLRSAQVTAPIDGTLYALPVRAGDFLRVGDLMAELADLHRVRVRAFVDEPELGKLEEGQPVEITWDAVPDRIWMGRTERIPKQVVARGTRSVGEVLCSVENEQLELLPNINVNVRIRVREREKAVVVPRGAVRVEASKRVVFLLEGNKLRKREIRVGIASATMYEVLEGLNAGDQVALPGDTELRDGLEVRATEPGR